MNDAYVADVGSSLTNESPLLYPRSRVATPNLVNQPVRDSMNIHRLLDNNRRSTTDLRP